MTTATLSSVNEEKQDFMVQEVFNQTFLFLAMKVRRPSFVVKIPRKLGDNDKTIEITVNNHDVSEAAAKATRTDLDLLPKEERNRLNTAYGRIWNYFRNTEVTYPHPTLDQLRLLPAKVQQQFFSGWPAVQSRFANDLEEFFQRYDDVIVPYGRELVLEYFNPDDAQRVMNRHLPPLARVRSRFGVKLVQGTFSYDDPNDAATAVQDLSESIRGKLEEALEATSAQLVNGKRLSEKTFNALKTAVATAKAFSDVVGTNVLTQIESMEKRLDSLGESIDLKPNNISMTDVVKSHKQLLNNAIDGLVTSIRDPETTDHVMRRFGARPRYLGF